MPMSNCERQVQRVVNAWIPVTAALPPLFERVLVYDPSIPKFKAKDGIRSHNFIVIGYYRGEDDLVSPWCVPDGQGPTHWMPLPKDPMVQVLEDDRGRFIASLDNEVPAMLARGEKET